MTEATLARTVLSIPDISCDHCARTVTQALTPLEGIASVAVDVPAKTAEVTYDPARVNISEMSEILAAEDYPVAAAS